MSFGVLFSQQTRSVVKTSESIQLDDTTQSNFKREKIYRTAGDSDCSGLHRLVMSTMRPDTTFIM
ncbi:hypothetical protein E2C01_071398 [Portunus trituberculatus]|uniref:Uncharacterized protein n=1 Tax=Portunus trituberculatus TaxID=210409 RepID=A0A5B7HV90_PORTR|nr:hypothetical protein [Portunus trituberculatus]